jgi:hypothetical protein
MQALRSARAAFAESEATYVRERARYENVAAGLEADKAALERQADALAREAAAEEARAHVCAAQGEVADILLARARDEAAFESGERRFHRDFKTQKELYANKSSQVRGFRCAERRTGATCLNLSSPPPSHPLGHRSQLESLIKELKRKRKELSDDSAGLIYQRSRFIDLNRLFSQKLELSRAARAGGGGVWDRAGTRDGKNADAGDANVWSA